MKKLKTQGKNSKTQGKNSRFRQIYLVELPKTGPISKPAIDTTARIGSKRSLFRIHAVLMNCQYIFM